MVEIFSNLSLGVELALSPQTLFYCFIGVAIGTMVGVLPGVGTMAALSMLFPLTFYLDPMTALVMLAGIYYGAAYGGSTAAILLNLPGTANTAVTCLDGYPMTQQGRGGVALFITTIASFAGSVLGLLMLVLFAPPLAQVALEFGSAEYFSLMAFGLLAATIFATGSPIRAIAMVVFGLLLGLVGADLTTGVARYTFGVSGLSDGLALTAVAVGLFGVSEVVANAGRLRAGNVSARDITWRSMLPSREDWRRSWKPLLRGAGVGGGFGALPGTGGTVATFVIYSIEKRISRDPEQFGKGAIEGVVAPESANNAAIQTAFIPTLTLGVPGDAIMAILLGVFLIHGITPGPQLIASEPALFWGLVISFLVGNVFLLILNIPLIGLWIRILSIPYQLLFPTIIMFICVGVYSVRLSVLDVFLVAVFGAVGYVLKTLKFPLAPVILGVVLGPLLEEHLRRAMLLARGDPSVFITRPISATFIALSVFLISFAVYSEWRRRLPKPARNGV